MHQIDQGRILDGIIKGYFLVEKHEDIIGTIYEAFNLANEGEPGPVFIEIPVELQLFRGEVGELRKYASPPACDEPDSETVKQISDSIKSAEKPGIYAGWGAVGAFEELKELAEYLGAPVATTLQGKSTFPADHPLHAGVGFGPSSIPAAENAFKNCDYMLAIGVRFSELATGSYGVRVPEKLIHIDINKNVFNKNYPAVITLECDSKIALRAILKELKSGDRSSVADYSAVAQSIKTEKEAYQKSWTGKKNKFMVSPGAFFQSLRNKTPDNSIMVVDDGKHTFLAAELFPVKTPRAFISPTDFNCMGYCVPAAIGAKLANPDRMVIGIVGDGALQMTGMELITAKTYGLGVICFVFHDGELGQISQFQKIPLNRKTATILGDINVEGLAIATGAHFISIRNDSEIEDGIEEAIEVSMKNVPVLVDVKIDYSQKTRMTPGVVKTNLSRFPTSEKIRFILRALKRNILG